MRRPFVVFLAFAAACTFLSRAGEVSITLPAETAVLKGGPGIESAQSNCITCHSVEYILTQPPMARKFWEAEVKKMKEKYGAPIAPEAAPAIVDYLTATYGAAEKK